MPNSISIRKPYLAASHDLVMAAFSFVISLYLRLGDEFILKAGPILISGTLIFTAICFLVFTYMRLYQGVWRYASIHDLVTMTKAVTLSIFIFLPVMFLYNRLEAVPRSVFVINWFILLALLGGPRFLFRMLRRRSIFPDFSKVEKKKKITVLLVGVNDHTEMFLRDVVGQADSEYEIVGILDGDDNKIGRRIYNIQIYGKPSSIVEVVEKLKRKGQTPQKILFSPGHIESDVI
jgi:O-antigen biosynthesis protein WbqV